MLSQSSPRDIEDLASLGRELKTCPYYGGRKAINRAEVLSPPFRFSFLVWRFRLVDPDALSLGLWISS